MVLDGSAEVLVPRTEADDIERSARQWRLDHLPAYAASRPWLLDAADLAVETTTVTVDQVAATIASAVAEKTGSATDEVDMPVGRERQDGYGQPREGR